GTRAIRVEAQQRRVSNLDGIAYIQGLARIDGRYIRVNPEDDAAKLLVEGNFRRDRTIDAGRDVPGEDAVVIAAEIRSEPVAMAALDELDGHKRRPLDRLESRECDAT